jgi:hypothetical protein
MNLAILSPGPSLQRFVDNPVEHDGYIGVNRAVEAHRCHWWVGVDPHAFYDAKPIGKPVIFTSDNTDAKEPIPEGYIVVRDKEAFSGIKDLCTLGSTPWRRWSGVYALMIGALVLKAKRLTLYGYDMTGHLFWDGTWVYTRSFVPPPPTMEDVRWQHERKYFNSVREWLIRRGVEVERVGNGSTV